MRDRFVPSAGPSFAVDDVGGSVQHDHDFTADPHRHLAVGGGFFNAGTGVTFESDETIITGTTNDSSIIPPYYALAYIQFIGA